MIIREALALGTKTLRKYSIPSATLDSEMLLSAVTRKPREFFYTYPLRALTFAQLIKFKALIIKRKRGEPVAYLVSKKEFYGRDFFVNKRVLVPRPETETIIEAVLEYCDTNALPSPNIADVGTGSGCIAITLALEIPRAKVLATDISKKALFVAQKNARLLKASVTFTRGNLLLPLKGKHIDIITANLPYGWKAWKNNTAAETAGLRFEPQQALFTKENGLYLYRLFFKQVLKRQQKPRLILCEFDPRQVTAIKRLTKELLPMYQLKTKKDLAGLHRIAMLEIKR